VGSAFDGAAEGRGAGAWLSLDGSRGGERGDAEEDGLEDEGFGMDAAGVVACSDMFEMYRACWVQVRMLGVTYGENAESSRGVRMIGGDAKEVQV